MLKEYGNSLLGWNIDLLARITCQQKIVQGQIQTVGLEKGAEGKNV
jgi:hypothetical protein